MEDKLLLLDEKHYMVKLAILEKYIDLQKYKPVSDYKNIKFEGIHWFSEIYTCFGLQK